MITIPTPREVAKPRCPHRERTLRHTWRCDKAVHDAPGVEDQHYLVRVDDEKAA